MTEKVPLEAMLRRASRMAENMFERDGEVTAFWLAAAGGRQRTIPDPDGRPAGGVRGRSWSSISDCGLPTSRVLSGNLPQRRGQGRTDSCSH